MKIESLYVVERKTKERDPEIDGFNYSDSDDEKDDEFEDLGFGNMTLKQLKKRCKTKKRKFSNSVGLTPKQESTGMQSEDVEFDLKEPLCNWKAKILKNPKSKRKCIQRSVCTSPKTALSFNYEQNLVTEACLQYSSDLCSPITVTAEVPEPADHFSINCNLHVGFRVVKSSEILEIVNHELEKREPVSFTEECQNCVLNEVSYEHLVDIEPTSPFLVVVGKNKDVDNQKKICQQSLVLPPPEFKTEGYFNHSLSNESSLKTFSPVKNQSSDRCHSPRSCSYLHDISGQTSIEPRVQVSDKVIDDILSCIELRHGGGLYISEVDVDKGSPPSLENGSLSSSADVYISPWDSHLSPDNYLVSMEDDSRTTEKRQPSISTIADAVRNCLNPDNELVVLEDNSPITEEKPPLPSLIVEAERNSSTVSHPCDVNELSTSKIRKHSHMEQWQPPERLLSTRKVISTTSQERHCLTMKSIELDDDVDNFQCKGKLCIENKDSSAGSDIEGAELSMNTRDAGLINQNKVMILKKPSIMKKGSPPKNGSPVKGSFKSPRLSCSLPLSTGSTSIQCCSESAIAFSQRQMQDVEFVAVNLMTELKSMKDIVEEKLLYEAYRSTSFKKDADEVKVAIKRARKAEKTARKWLSMMARDCNRFCKIMKLTENSASNSEQTFHKERKKIIFADEAGGVLCHVKLFESDIASMEPNGEKQ